MKTLYILVAVCLVPLIAECQKKSPAQILQNRLEEYKIPSQDGFPFYELVDTGFNGKSKTEIHKAGRSTLAKSFGDSKEVIRVDDIESGSIIGKGTAKFKFSIIGTNLEAIVPFVIEITSKDGKYRIQLKDITKVYAFTVGEGETSLEKIAKASNSYNDKFWPRFDKRMNEALETIKSGIRTELNKKDDFYP